MNSNYTIKQNSLLNFFTTIFLILIFSLIPWGEFINSNSDEIEQILNNNFYILIAIYFLFIIIFYFIIKFLFKNKNNIYYISLIGISVWIFFQYNFLKTFFKSILSGKFLWHFSSELSLFLIILFIVLVTVLLDKIKFLRIFIIFFMILNLFYLSIILFPKLRIIKSDKKKDIIEKQIIENLNFKKNPNIYFFVMDAMQPLNEFEAYFNIDTEVFKDHYQNYGYTHYHNTINLYDWTIPVLTSFFYMEEIIYENQNETNKFSRDLNLKSNIPKVFPIFLKEEYSPKLLTELRKYGYDFKWIGNNIANCSKTNFKYCLKNKKKSYIDIYTFQSFLEKSPIIQILNRLSKLPFLSDLINYKALHSNPVNELKQFIISNKEFITNTNPQFYFIHDMGAHHPYLVDSNCKSKKFDGKYNLEGYKNSYQCNIKKIKDIIEILHKYDPNSVVIFQSDHSWGMSRESEIEFGQRTKIFNLIKYNPNCKISASNEINISKLPTYILGCVK